MRVILRVLSLFAVLALSARGQVVLDFDTLSSLPNYGDIPASYGDTLDVNIADIAYATRDSATGDVIAANLDFWSTGYGDLDGVALATQNGALAEITLVPAEGYGVRLVSFDLAGWPLLDRSATVLRLVDANRNVVYDFAAAGPVAIEGDLFGARHSTFVPDLTFDGTLTLQWGTDWNIGIDNLSFEAVPLSVIPEPSTWALLAVGLGVVWLAWRGRRRG